jgi:hypothetical protein
MGKKIDDGLTKSQRYYRKNAEKRKASHQVWVENNREHLREYDRERYADPVIHAKKLESAQSYRDTHVEEHRASTKNYYDTHLEEIRSRQEIYRRGWSSNTIRNHIKRGNNVTITLDTLSELAQRTDACYYCGCVLNWSYGNKGGGRVRNSPTLDRVNNNPFIDHIWKGDDQMDGAVAIVCHTCNVGKSGLAFLDWIEHITTTFFRPMISLHHTHTRQELRERRRWCNSTLYSHKIRGYEVSLLINDLEKVALNVDDCQYCGQPLLWHADDKRGENFKFVPSLDRVLNGQSITHVWKGDENTEGAVAIVCGRCNLSKQDRSFNNWFEDSNRIAEKFSHLL